MRSVGNAALRQVLRGGAAAAAELGRTRGDGGAGDEAKAPVLKKRPPVAVSCWGSGPCWGSIYHSAREGPGVGIIRVITVKVR